MTGKGGQKFALDRFRKIELRLPVLLADLVDADAYRRDGGRAVPPINGVYLFSEGEAHRYVGRTRNANRRLGQHIWKSSGENSAPFAFNIARRSAQETGIDVSGTRKHVAGLLEFKPHFLAAKQRVREMDFRAIAIPDAVLCTVFEVYASLALATEGEFNLFETH